MPVRRQVAFDDAVRSKLKPGRGLCFAGRAVLARAAGVEDAALDRAMTGQFVPGMVLCVESRVGEAGPEPIKLETQVLVTGTGTE